MAARAVHTAIRPSFSRPLHAIGPPYYAATSRAHHTATAKFTSLGPKGAPVTKEISIHACSPGGAYVMIPTEVGFALRAASSLPQPPVPPQRGERLPLTYFHDTQHFALDQSTSYPRLDIPEPLPPQSDGKTSPATLYLYGIMHQIALDGTQDAAFAEIASTILPDLGPALDRLKDM
ncbi:hypothetical protein DM02DRAFT_627578 [Periconia macrospinosa]|uniref:Uncharacterized protein n=1 Tax=Periconia macrospinosa TaxID=97972 RepID=A0A2V1DTY4_9PLEO|nr:hypothetical protein DM02DRAFT_627578 [Periconia macrospinosa]